VVSQLEQFCKKTPRQDLHPDLCVALGAGVLASRLQGHDVERVLVDVSPFSFGPSYLGERDGFGYEHCYHPVIHRNTPLPVTRTDEYFTASENQTAVEIDIYQGDDPDALKNVHVGHFRVEGLTPTADPNPVLCRMRLDVDGILHVTAIEKNTSLSKHVAISGATRRRSSVDIARGREELDRLFATRTQGDMDIEPIAQATPLMDAQQPPEPAAQAETPSQSDEVNAAAAANALVERCRRLMGQMHADDQEEAINLIEDITTATGTSDSAALATACKELSEFLFFVEGK
jgi:molecular chaperone DnaK (HSP70)